MSAVSSFFLFFTLILGINFLHERNTPLQIKRKRFHQVQIFFNIIYNNVAWVAIGRVQHGGSSLSPHRPTPAPVDNKSLLITVLLL